MSTEATAETEASFVTPVKQVKSTPQNEPGAPIRRRPRALALHELGLMSSAVDSDEVYKSRAFNRNVMEISDEEETGSYHSDMAIPRTPPRFRKQTTLERGQPRMPFGTIDSPGSPFFIFADAPVPYVKAVCMDAANAMFRVFAELWDANMKVSDVFMDFMLFIVLIYQWPIWVAGAFLIAFRAPVILKQHRDTIALD